MIVQENNDLNATQITNPFIQQRADLWVYRHIDGFYYFTATVPANDRLVVRRAETIQGLASASEKVIWEKHSAETPIFWSITAVITKTLSGIRSMSLIAIHGFSRCTGI